MFRATVAYGVACFAVLQIVEPIMHGLHWPDAVLSWVVAILAIGFPLVVAVAWIFDVRERREQSARDGSRLTLAAALACAGLAAAGLVYWYARRQPAPALAGPSIAVLPLVNLSSDKEQEYFSDGLSEELLNLLAQVPGLHVAARTSAFAFKGQNEDVRAIGEKLHVATLLEGSVRKAGAQIRITTQLINAADGYHLWSATYDRQLNDVFAVQDEIARAVVAALKLRLMPAPGTSERRTASPEAYNEYLLGRRFFHLNNIPAFGRAVDAYGKAVALDPGYAPAWAGLALARFWFGQEAESEEAVHRWLQLASEAADKAIAAGPDLPDGYLARGFIRINFQQDWDGAAADLDRAVQLGPDDADALTSRSSLYRTQGKMKEAIALLRRGVELDPLNARTWSGLGSALLFDGQTGPAREALNRSLEISPEQVYTAAWLGFTYLQDGRMQEAAAAFERSTHEVFRLAGAAAVECAQGHAAAGQKAIDALTAKYAHNAAYQIGTSYGFCGNADRAFEWLDRAYEHRDGGLAIVKKDPLLAKVRGDPRYAALLRKMKLPPD